MTLTLNLLMLALWTCVSSPREYSCTSEKSAECGSLALGWNVATGSVSVEVSCKISVFPRVFCLDDLAIVKHFSIAFSLPDCLYIFSLCLAALLLGACTNEQFSSEEVKPRSE